MLKVNYSLAGIMIALSLTIYFTANSYTKDAAQWPQFFAILLILLSIWLIVDTRMKPNKEKKSNEEEKGNNSFLLFTMIGSIIYLGLMDVIGFLILTPIFLGLLFWVLKYRSIIKLVALSIGITICIDIVFQFLLNIPIPQGLLNNLFI